MRRINVHPKVIARALLDKGLLTEGDFIVALSEEIDADKNEREKCKLEEARRPWYKCLF